MRYYTRGGRPLFRCPLNHWGTKLTSWTLSMSFCSWPKLNPIYTLGCLWQHGQLFHLKFIFFILNLDLLQKAKKTASWIISLKFSIRGLSLFLKIIKIHLLLNSFIKILSEYPNCVQSKTSIPGFIFCSFHLNFSTLELKICIRYSRCIPICQKKDISRKLKTHVQ